jgi:hypothetical protein
MAVQCWRHSEGRKSGRVSLNSSAFWAAARCLASLGAVALALDVQDFAAVDQAVDEGDDAGGVREDVWRWGVLRKQRPLVPLQRIGGREEVIPLACPTVSSCAAPDAWRARRPPASVLPCSA